MSISLRPRWIPIDPPRQGNYPIDDLPNELLSYVFQICVELEQRWWDKDLKLKSHENQWVSLNQVSHGDNSNSRILPLVFDFMPETFQYRSPFPPQVLVSHVCRRWRSVALNTSRFWTMLRFYMYPGLAQKKEYISRSNGLPLTIELDCGIEDRALDYDTSADEASDSDGSEDDHHELSDSDTSGDDGVSDSGTSGDDEDSDSEDEDLSLEDLEQVLDLLEPAISQWGRFNFYSSSPAHIHCLMSRLNKFPAAPCLKSFRLHRYRMQSDTNFVPAARYLPFHGQAPNLKEVIFWGIHIDWYGALPTFLRGLRVFGLSALKDDDRPSYAAFAEIIKNSPGLQTLTSSITGPLLSDDIEFDPHAAVPIPLTIPSLTRVLLQGYHQKYAIAFMQHMDMPNVTQLVLNLYREDYSDFVKVLATPTKGRSQSLLRKITHLEITGASLDLASMKILLSELSSMTYLDLQPARNVAEVVCDALVDPSVLAMGSESLPKIFCPNLKEITTYHLDEEGAKALVAGRRDAGVPLKRIRNILY